jgi:hypothetical protein
MFQTHFVRGARIEGLHRPYLPVWLLLMTWSRFPSPKESSQKNKLHTCIYWNGSMLCHLHRPSHPVRFWLKGIVQRDWFGWKRYLPIDLS